MSQLTDEEEITKRAYDKSAQAWADHNSNTDYWIKELKRFHELQPSGSILEIGVGWGRDVRRLTELGYKYTGTDISEGLLAIARERFPEQKFLKQSVYELSFPEKFDGFWACAVLLHVPKKRMDEALRSIKSQLKSGAIGFISIKDGQSEGLQHDKKSNENMHRFFSYWTKSEFAKVLEKNGFKIVDYTYRPVSKDTRWHNFFVKLP